MSRRISGLAWSCHHLSLVIGLLVVDKRRAESRHLPGVRDGTSGFHRRAGSGNLPRTGHGLDFFVRIRLTNNVLILSQPRISEGFMGEDRGFSKVEIDIASRRM
jgi:hypothetical protein